MNDHELVVQEALRWLRYSAEDLDVAQRLLAARPSVPRHVCWHSQQAAEKALKAVLELEAIDHPYTHDLDVLRDLLPASWPIRVDRSGLSELSEWAVEARYPGDWAEPSEADATRAEAEARAVHNSVAAEFRRRGLRADGEA